jgi:hypothetical protein
MRTILLLIALWALLLCNLGAALEVSPAVKLLDSPGEHTYTVRVQDATDVAMRAEGDLAGAIRLSRIDAATYELNILVPEDLEPGDHVQRIIASSASGTGDFVGASVEVVTLLVVRKLYPDAYLVITDVQAAVDEGKEDETVLSISLENRGGKSVTPKPSLVRARGTEKIQADTLGPGAYAIVQHTVRGRGIEQMEIVEESKQLRKTITIAVGHPVITGLHAVLGEDPGPIKPVLVEANVSWNEPVGATLTVGENIYTIVINGTLSENFYSQTNASTADVMLSIGRQTRTAIARHENDLSATQEQSTSLAALWILLAVLMTSALIVLWFVLRRHL